MEQFDVPILISVFRKVDTLQELLKKIKAIHPKYLYFVCDGPRNDVKGEEEKVMEVKKLIADLDIPNCQIKKLYYKQNFGPQIIGEKYMDWFFSHVEEGIIFEDDDVPDESFFYFCKEMLDKYRNTEQIKYITGSNFVSSKVKSEYSYYFSRIPSFWGFATWKRVWNETNYYLAKELPEIEYEEIISSLDKKHQAHFRRLFDYFRNDSQLPLDQKLMFDMWGKEGLAIVPSFNLISNIGVGHTEAASKNILHQISNLPTKSIIDIKHPEKIEVNKEHDRKEMKYIFNAPMPLGRRIKNKLKRAFSNS